MNGFVSLGMLDGQLCGPGRKNRFGLKLREAKRTFSITILEGPIRTKMSYGLRVSSAHEILAATPQEKSSPRGILTRSGIVLLSAAAGALPPPAASSSSSKPSAQRA